MPVRVEIQPPLREHTEGRGIIEVEGNTVETVLQALGSRFPGLQQRMFKNGVLTPQLIFELNTEDIRFLDQLATPVQDGDQLAIHPPVAGG